MARVSWNRVLAAAAVMACATWGAALAGCPRSDKGEITHDGLTRRYRLFVPSSYAAGLPVPLVLVLHGGRGTARQAQYLTRMNEVAEREGFLVAYPESAGRQWNDGRDARFGRRIASGDAAIDDVGFIAALIDHLSATHAVDPARIYATGVSNGAMMCHRLGLELSDRLAAIAPVIGAMPEGLAAAAQASQPLSVLVINGTADRLVPWDGGAVCGRERWGRILSVDDTVAFWSKHNNAPLAEVIALPDRDPDDGTRVSRDAYGPGDGGSEVVLYRVEGGGHTWPGGPRYQRQWLLGKVSHDLDASETIWAFFHRHARP